MGYATYEPVEVVLLSPGDKVKLHDGGKNWWTVKAVSENFVAVTQQVPFQKSGVLQYSVLDWRNGRRGPCNLIGYGYGEGTYDEAECAEMLAEFESGQLEVSHRNNVRLAIMEVKAA